MKGHIQHIENVCQHVLRIKHQLTARLIRTKRDEVREFDGVEARGSMWPWIVGPTPDQIFGVGGQGFRYDDQFCDTWVMEKVRVGGWG